MIVIDEARPIHADVCIWRKRARDLLGASRFLTRSRPEPWLSASSFDSL